MGGEVPQQVCSLTSCSIQSQKSGKIRLLRALLSRATDPSKTGHAQPIWMNCSIACLCRMFAGDCPRMGCKDKFLRLAGASAGKRVLLAQFSVRDVGPGPFRLDPEHRRGAVWCPVALTGGCVWPRRVSAEAALWGAPPPAELWVREAAGDCSPPGQ